MAQRLQPKGFECSPFAGGGIVVEIAMHDPTQPRSPLQDPAVPTPPQPLLGRVQPLGWSRHDFDLTLSRGISCIACGHILPNASVDSCPTSRSRPVRMPGETPPASCRQTSCRGGRTARMKSGHLSDALTRPAIASAIRRSAFCPASVWPSRLMRPSWAQVGL